MIAALALASALALPADDSSIRVAVIPDTQTESYSVSAKRSKWIADRDFDAVAHVGDVTNWGARDFRQFTRAERWMNLLPNVPRAVAIGNHDTAAVGVGGSAYDPPRTGILLRDTRAFNKVNLVKPNRRGWEANKVDNTWTRINSKWAMLTLELWPRPGAVAWANKVIKARPGTKWIIVTHSCLNSRGQITNGSSYGSTSPMYMRDKLIRPNKNIRVVLCGHIGTTATLKDKQATWILTNRTTDGRVRLLDLSSTTTRTWLRSTQ